MLEVTSSSGATVGGIQLLLEPMTKSEVTLPPLVVDDADAALPLLLPPLLPPAEAAELALLPPTGQLAMLTFAAATEAANVISRHRLRFIDAIPLNL